MSDWVTLKDALGLTLRPIDAWPGNARHDRIPGPFSAGLKDTLATLKRELAALNARRIVLQIAFREGDFRADGLPRANAVATHPGVILAFESRHGTLRLSFDGFTKWQNNLRAVAMHLEHLRLASLYGVGTDGQQYKGCLALPAPPESGFGCVEDAAAWLREASGVEGNYDNPDVLAAAFRAAAKRLHPDPQGGDADGEEFVRLTAVRRMLAEAGARKSA